MQISSELEFDGFNLEFVVFTEKEGLTTITFKL